MTVCELLFLFKDAWPSAIYTLALRGGCPVCGAFEQLLGERREFDPGGARPDFGLLPSVGVGHSMGSALSVVQQARAASHAALVLFSFSARGLEKYLLPDEKKFANRPEETWANLSELARARFSTPYPRGGRRGGEASPAALGHGPARTPAPRPPRAAMPHSARRTAAPRDSRVRCWAHGTRK